VRRKVEYRRDGANIVATIYGPDYGACYDETNGYDRWRIEETFKGTNLGWLYDKVAAALMAKERADELARIASDIDGARHEVRVGW